MLSELFRKCVKICLEQWCTTMHYFAFLSMNYERKKLNDHLLEVYCSLKIYHAAMYTFNNSKI